MSARDLKRAEAAAQAAFARYEAARKRRNRLVRQALAEGRTQAQIARETGLTRGRIHQIQSTTPEEEQ